MVRLWVLALLLIVWTASAAAKSTSPFEGRWALLAEGRVLAILELRRDSKARDGWSGGMLRPDRMGIPSSHRISNISGPLVRRPLLSARRQGEGLELSIAGRPGEDPIVLLFKAIDADHAELSFGAGTIPPLPLVRTSAQAVVEPLWPANRHYQISTPRPINPEMKALFEEDQADRNAGPNIDWAVVTPRDEERRARTLALLKAGKLHSGDDFWHAAFIFQHGGEPDSYLLAHTLAVIATARGRPDATWIAAATLDRYLQNIGRKQIYGTQYSMPDGQPTNQEPYDRTLVSDALRSALGVPSLEEQEARRAEFEQSRERQPSSGAPR